MSSVPKLLGLRRSEHFKIIEDSNELLFELYLLIFTLEIKMEQLEKNLFKNK